jgi:serine/threonine protein kinase
MAADSDIHLKVARQVIMRILLRLSPSSESQSDTDTPGKFNARESADGHVAQVDLEVRWMASGNTACLVLTSPTMCVSEVKAQVLEQANVPVEEQRLFSSGKELGCEASMDQAKHSQLMLVRSVSDPRVTNLAHFRCTSSFESLCRSDFTMVRKVNTGINGDIFKYEWRRSKDNVPVAVKKLRNSALRDLQNSENDERCIHMSPKGRFARTEDALTEIGVLSYLSKQQDVPSYLLKMLSIFAETHFTWLVTEFADGGELFDVAAAGGIAESTIQEYMWQLLQAVEYLHAHCIGHRDISLENVLLKGGNVRLMDYGMAVRSHSSTGTPLRYFREAGKSFYRAPECYVPTREETAVTAPAFSKPGDVIMAKVAPNFLCEVRLPAHAVPGQPCLADVWGYAAAPADVFALGICMFILSFQCPAWEVAKLSNQFFAHVYNCEENGLESLLRTWGKECLSPEAMHMLSDMLHADPTKRPTAASSFSYSWFSALPQRIGMDAECAEYSEN